MPPILVYNLVSKNTILDLTIKNEFFGGATDVYMIINRKDLNITSIEYSANNNTVVRDQSTEKQYIFYFPHLYQPDEVKFNITLGTPYGNTTRAPIYGGSNEAAILHPDDVPPDFRAVQSLVRPLHDVWIYTIDEREWMYDHPVIIITIVPVAAVGIMFTVSSAVRNFLSYETIEERHTLQLRLEDF